MNATIASAPTPPTTDSAMTVDVPTPLLCDGGGPVLVLGGPELVDEDVTVEPESDVNKVVTEVDPEVVVPVVAEEAAVF